MRKNSQFETQASRTELATGQVWSMDGSHLHICLVGKRLVHFKHFKADTKRAPISLASISELQSFLRRHKAVLRRKTVRIPPVK